jgi:hypothetical protein
MKPQLEFSFNLDITIIAFNEDEAREIQERIATEVFEDDDVIQIYADRIDESNTVTTADR